MDDVLFEKKSRGLPNAADLAPEELVQSWEMIAAGRYMPRRTRGSFPGRELG
jgi:hypothetical protein